MRHAKYQAHPLEPQVLRKRDPPIPQRARAPRHHQQQHPFLNDDENKVLWLCRTSSYHELNHCSPGKRTSPPQSHSHSWKFVCLEIFCLHVSKVLGALVLRFYTWLWVPRIIAIWQWSLLKKLLLKNICPGWWEGDQEETVYACKQLIHFIVRQKLTLLCKASIFQ